MSVCLAGLLNSIQSPAMQMLVNRLKPNSREMCFSYLMSHGVAVVKVKLIQRNFANAETALSLIRWP